MKEIRRGLGINPLLENWGCKIMRETLKWGSRIIFIMLLMIKQSHVLKNKRVFYFNAYTVYLFWTFLVGYLYY